MMLDSTEQQIRDAERLTMATARIAIERALSNLATFSDTGKRALPMLDRMRYDDALSSVRAAADHLDGRS